MKIRIAVLAAISTALLTMAADVNSQTPQKASTFTIAGHEGEAQLIKVNGKSYVEIEALARLTQGTLSFKANQTILTLPPADSVGQAAVPHPKAGLSTAFIQASIEELSVIREWRVAIVNAVQTNTPLGEEWISSHHRLADKNLALASAAASTDDDHNAFPLLTSEFNNMQKLSDLYLTMRKQASFISPDHFDSALAQQVLSCEQGFQSMTENHVFQDQAACH